MRRTRRRSRGWIAILAALLLIAAAAFALVRTGVYNVAADDPHYPLTTALLEQVREASVHARAGRLTVPKDLMTDARVVQGAGNYDAMCTQCHLAPGMPSTELSRGLYPAPPNLTQRSVDAAEAFWVIKHGIKSTGMPAWGGSMDDEYIWNMAAFLQRLPELDAAGYRALVDRSDGHSHGGGESTPHDHGAAPGAADAATDHPHAPGTPPHDDAPEHVDPPGTPAHSH